jgi:hypothetical protein
MRDRINEIILQANAKVLNFLFWLFGSLSFVDVIDWGLRVLSGIIAVAVVDLYVQV